ncbi:MAG TPA: hypothetical protein VF469_01470 [Kofleriaceae bacterium]
MRSVLLVASLVLAIAGTAAAQPATSTMPYPSPGLLPAPSTPSSPSSLTPSRPPSGDERSEDTALLLSLAGTLASWTFLFTVPPRFEGDNGKVELALAIGASGTLLGPSLGHWYAHSYATRGLGLRLAGAGVFALALAASSRCEDDCNTSGPITGAALLALGLYIGGSLDDLVTAPGDARRYNQRFQSLAVVPMVRPDSGGLLLTGRF